MLIDPTIHLLSRHPQYGLLLDCMVCLTMPAEFEAGDKVGFANGKTRIGYKRWDDQKWRYSHAWNGQKAFTRNYAAKIIEAVSPGDEQ